jgi:hypothetical protein
MKFVTKVARLLGGGIQTELRRNPQCGKALMGVLGGSTHNYFDRRFAVAAFAPLTQAFNGVAQFR